MHETPETEDRAPGHTLFEQPWWLEALAPGAWGEATVLEGGRPVARLPYVMRRRLGVVVLTQPPLTHTLGPWTAPVDGPYNRRLGVEHRRLGALIDELPRHDLFRQQFHPSQTNALPFHWRGFALGVRYTYRFEDVSDPERVYANFQGEVRRHVRRASSHLEVRVDDDVDVLLAANAKTFARQGLRAPYPDELVRRLDAACVAHDARRVLVAADASGRVHGAMLVVHDERTAYVLMAGQDPELRSSGAMTLLHWEAIRYTATVSQTFDFEGSMLRGVEQFYRGFGARQVPLISVARHTPRGRAAEAARGAPAAARLAARRLREHVYQR